MDSLQTTCDKKKTYCIIAILDSVKDIQLVFDVAGKIEDRRVRFMYSMVGDQPGFEEAWKAKGPTAVAINW